MKLLLSSPASSCSSSLSNASFGASICRSKTASAGCLVGVFRNFFCSRSLPTYPSDHTAEESNTLNLIAEGDMENKSAPGIVARLMGLDSLPEIDVDQAQLAPNSISLSRSMNSVDYLCERSGSQRRRVKSTFSSRELPIFLNSENEDFLVLSFENVKESKELRRRKRNSNSRERKTEKLPEKKKEEEPEEIKRVVLKIFNDEEKPSRTISADSTIPSKDCYGRSKLSENSSIVIHHKQISGDRKSRTKESEIRDETKMEESINISEDSSPVSVLDRCQFLGDPELTTSVSAGLNSRRKLSTELENYENPGPRNDNNLICDDEEHVLKAKEISYVGELTKKLHKRSRREMREMIRRLTEAEMVGSRCNNGDFQSVGAEIQWVMLQELIDELVHQLSVTHQELTNFSIF